MSEQNQIAECKSCGAEIVWMKTKKGKNIPVDLPAEEDAMRMEVLSADLYDRDLHTTHFDTCPNAEKHRGGNSGSRPAPAASDPSASINAKRLNTALAALESIANDAPDGMRSVELAKTAISQIRAMR